MTSPPYRIALVCLGNICRSPMAHVILTDRLREAGLTDRVEVSSAGTGGWHTGEPMDRRAADALDKAGYDSSDHRAQKFTIDWYADHDLLLAMDESNFADMADLSPSVQALTKLKMFRSFDPEATDGDIEVPDPWFGGDQGFANVLTMIERTSGEIVDALPALIE